MEIKNSFIQNTKNQKIWSYREIFSIKNSKNAKKKFLINF